MSPAAPHDGGWRMVARPGPGDRTPQFHARYRAGRPRLPVDPGAPDPLHTLPGDRLRYLLALLRESPQRPPALPPEEWQGFLDLLRPHGVYPLLADRFRSWPEECRPAAGVAPFLDAAQPEPAATGDGSARPGRRGGHGHAQRRSPARRR